MPHALALFSLVPLNERAEAVLTHRSNEHLVSRLKDGTLALDIGHVRPLSGNNATLATLGRNGDVIVEGSSIAKLQCSFEIDLDTRVVMFYDRSHSQTSQVSGDNATPFEYGRLRKVVVQEKINTIIGMGGVGRNLVQFELEWHCSLEEMTTRVKDRETVLLEENPRFARTIDEIDTALPSRSRTRIHTPGHRPPRMRYIKAILLGKGQFGTVYKAVNVDTGKLMAVKMMQRPTKTGSQEEWMKLRREVEILSRVSHVSDPSQQSLVHSKLISMPGAHRGIHRVTGLGCTRGRAIHGFEGWNPGVIDTQRMLCSNDQSSRNCFASYTPGDRLSCNTRYHSPRCEAREYSLHIAAGQVSLPTRGFRPQQPPNHRYHTFRNATIHGSRDVPERGADTQSRCVVALCHDYLDTKYERIQRDVERLQELWRCSKDGLVNNLRVGEYPGNGKGEPRRARVRGTDAHQVLQWRGTYYSSR